MSNSRGLCFVPELLPDELLYSYIGRLTALNGLGSPKTRMQLLFGSGNKMPCVDLPTGLNILQRQLGANSPCTSPEDLIEVATLYPYHRPFLTVERSVTAESILLQGDGKRLKTIIGRVANRFGAAPALRYCPVCSREDVRNNGTTYWHRSHQLPGVISCYLHGAVLFEHPGPPTTDRQRFVLAPVTNADSPDCRQSALQQREFAVLSNDFLNARLPALEAEHRKGIYVRELHKQGFVQANRVDHQSLIAEVREHYQDFREFYHRERLLATEPHPLSWVRTLIDRPSRATHPICHLLLIGYLFRTVDKFKESLAAENQHRDYIQRAEEGGSCGPAAVGKELDQRFLLNAELSCRQVALQLNLSVTTIVNRRKALGVVVSSRPKTLKAERLAPIVEALNHGSTPQEIASSYDVSLSTAYRLRSQFPEQMRAHASAICEVKRTSKRASWLSLIGCSSSVSKARAIAGSTYAWLYRHDKEWLLQKSKIFQTPRTTRLRVDWDARDQSFCEQVASFVGEVKSLADRPRISRTLMTRNLDQALIRANITRLPKLNSLLTQTEESLLAYQRYRIDCAIEWLGKHNLPIIDWRIRRIAGIRRWNREHISYVAEKNIDRIDLTK